MESNRQTIYQVYSVLKKYSSDAQPMNATHIMNKMTVEFNLPKPPDRKTIYSHLRDLQDLSDMGILDGKLSTKGTERKTGYVFKPSLTKAEAKLLCDAIASSRFISKEDSQDLIAKLARTYESEFSLRYGYLLELKNPKSKSYNSDLFDSIGKIAEAVDKRKKVTFQYLMYDLKKNLVPKQTEDDGYITVNPYYLIWTLNHYYLYCENDKAGESRFLRMDKIAHVKLLDESVKPLEARFNVRDYSHNQAFMFGGEMERIKLRCQMRVLGQVIDFFGEDVYIKPIDDNHFEAQIVTSIDSIKYWVLQYITAIEHIRPERLRTIIVDYLEDALGRNRG